MSGHIEARLTELGIILPTPANPAANYVPTSRSGSLIFVSGQIPFGPEGLEFIGRVGDEFDVHAGQQAARLCGLHILAQLKAAAEGNLDNISSIIRLGVFVNSAPGFSEQHLVANGASDLMAEVFGEAGRHCRSAIGTSELPLKVAVEVDAIAEIS